MELSVNGQAYSTYEAQIACALKLYINTEDSPLSDETIGSIISSMRNGLRVEPIPYHDLVSGLQNSSDALHRAIYDEVCSNKDHWEPKAKEVYRKWWDMHSEIFQR